MKHSVLSCINSFLTSYVRSPYASTYRRLLSGIPHRGGGLREVCRGEPRIFCSGPPGLHMFGRDKGQGRSSTVWTVHSSEGPMNTIKAIPLSRIAVALCTVWILSAGVARAQAPSHLWSQRFGDVSFQNGYS